MCSVDGIYSDLALPLKCICLVTWVIHLMNFFYLYNAFLQSTRDIKRVISKRDGCEYLKQVPSIDGSLMRSSGHILLSLLPILG
jgi:hypothetical protein